MSERSDGFIVVENVGGIDLEIKECVLPQGGIKRIAYDSLLRDDVRLNWRRGYLKILDWPKGKEPISWGPMSTPQYQLPDGVFKKDEVESFKPNPEPKGELVLGAPGNHKFPSSPNSEPSALDLAQRQDWWLEFSPTGSKILGYDPCIAGGWDPACAFKVVKTDAFERLRRDYAALEKVYAMNREHIGKLQAALEAKEAESTHNFKAAENWKEAALDQQAHANEIEEQRDQARAELATEIEQHAITSRDVGTLRKDYLELETAAREREGKLVGALKRILFTPMMDNDKKILDDAEALEAIDVIVNEALTDHEKETK